MHIVLTGATGLVGSAVLVALRARPDVSKISILSRRPVPMLENTNDSRIEVIIHDFNGYPPDLQEKLRGASGCVWALGVSQTAVSKEEYIHITKEMTLEAAQAFRRLRNRDSDDFNFVYISGEGATSTPGPFTPLFGRVKGETEVALVEMQSKTPNFRPLIIRPSHVDAKGHQAIAPYIPQPTAPLKAANTVLGPILRGFLKSYNSPTAPLGEFLAGLATGRFQDRLQGDGVEKHGGSTIVQNVGFRRLMRLT